MKLHQLSQSTVKKITEGTGDIDKKAGDELDGESSINLDDIVSGNISKDNTEQDSSLEVPTDDIVEPENNSTEMANMPTPGELKTKGHSGFTLSNVSSQIDGMVNKWFQFAVDMDPEKKEKFLALGERLSEISDMIKTEFN